MTLSPGAAHQAGMRRPLEKGVRISPASAPGETRSYGKPKYEPAERDKPKRYNPAAAEKVATEDPRPAQDAEAPRKPKKKDEAKPKAKFKPKYQGNPKDKGKPKWKGKGDRAAGDQVRTRPKA